MIGEQPFTPNDNRATSLNPHPLPPRPKQRPLHTPPSHSHARQHKHAKYTIHSTLARTPSRPETHRLSQVFLARPPQSGPDASGADCADSSTVSPSLSAAAGHGATDDARSGAQRLTARVPTSLSPHSAKCRCEGRTLDRGRRRALDLRVLRRHFTMPATRACRASSITMLAVCRCKHTAMRSFSSSFHALSDTPTTAGSYAVPI
jgi:hypothetical protein